MCDKSSRFYFAVLLPLMAVIAFAFAHTCSNQPFAYDEADYMYAGSRGFLANYLDQPSLSLPEFIRRGMELSKNRGLGVEMSQYVRASGDIAFYRHYHGPIYTYWLALMHKAGLSSASEFRASGLVFHLLSTTLVFWMCVLAFPS